MRIDRLDIYSRGGTLKVSAPGMDGTLLTKCRRVDTEMGSDVLEVELTSNTKLNIIPGDYCIVGGEKYIVNIMPRMQRSGQIGCWAFEVSFDSVKYSLANAIFLLPDDTVDDYYTGNISTMLNVLLASANRVNNIFELGTVISDSTIITEQFTEMSCLEALHTMCEKFNAVYYLGYDSNRGKSIINVIYRSSYPSTGLTFSYGHVGGAYAITRDALVTDGMCTRLYVYGSSENISSGYRHSRLCLPNKSRNQSYVENASRVSQYGLIEGVALVDDVKPHATFVITRVVDTNTLECAALSTSSQYGFKLDAVWTAEDYNEWLEMRGYVDNEDTENYFLDEIVANRYKKYLTCGEAHVTFNTGRLAGMVFSIRESSISDDGSRFSIVPNQEYEGDIQFEHTYPDGNAFRMAVGDEIVISDIDLPIALIHRAEAELATRAQEELSARAPEVGAYSIQIDSLAIDTMNLSNLKSGFKVRINDAEIGVNAYFNAESVEWDYLAGDVSVNVSNIVRRATSIVAGESVDADIDGVPTTRTELTSIFTANYGGSCNMLHISAGDFTNASIMGKKRIWHVHERTISLERSAASYVIFLKVAKRTSYASVVLMEDRTGEGMTIGEVGGLGSMSIQGGVGARDSSSTYFRIGYISEAREYYGGGVYRSIRMDYGTSSVNAGDITAGTIENDNGSIIDIASGIVGSGMLVREGVPLNTAISSIESNITKLLNKVTNLASRVDALEKRQ